MIKREFSTPYGRRPADRPWNPAASTFPSRSGRCIALVDARFLGWLLGQGGAGDATLRRRALVPVLSAALAQASLELDVRRVYWYTDKPDTQCIDDQITRGVLPEDADGGVSLIRALGADLLQLAQQRAVDHLLVVSDDERLLTRIDEAQMCGVAVHVLADERAGDIERMGRDDPGWASLLAQADRRVPLGASLMTDLVQERGAAGDAAAGAPVDAMQLRTEIESLIRAWWDEESEDQREDLRDELRLSRGIPAEVDRVLLLRLRRTLGRALSWPEKKLMRECARATVLGAQDAATAREASNPVEVSVGPE